MTLGRNSKAGYPSAMMVLAAALIGGLCCLQLVTKTPVQYRYQVRVFASSGQFHRLRIAQEMGVQSNSERQKRSEIQTAGNSSQQGIQVEKVEVLSTDDSNSKVGRSSINSNNLTALRITCSMNERLTIQELQSRLRAIASSQLVPSPDSPSAAERRKLRWECESLEHALRQIVKASAAQQPDSKLCQVSQFTLLSNHRTGSSEFTFTPASSKQEHSADTLQPCLPPDDAESLDRMESNLRSRLKELQAALEDLDDPNVRDYRPDGFQLLLAGPFSCSVLSGPTSKLGLFFVITVATLTGYATWRYSLPKRSFSSRGADELVRVLSADGLTYFGEIAVQLTPLPMGMSEVPRSAQAALQGVIDVLFWAIVAWIAFRAIEDPLWRSLLLHNPLGALGRLLVGF